MPLRHIGFLTNSLGALTLLLLSLCVSLFSLLVRILRCFYFFVGFEGLVCSLLLCARPSRCKVQIRMKLSCRWPFLAGIEPFSAVSIFFLLYRHFQPLLTDDVDDYLFVVVWLGRFRCVWTHYQPLHGCVCVLQEFIQVHTNVYWEDWAHCSFEV